LALALFFRLLGAAGLRPGWFIAALGVYAIYFLAISYGGKFIPLEDYVGPHSWNWAGKIAAIAASLVMLAALALTTKSISLKGAGFTMLQREGSVVPAFVMIAILTGSMVALEILASDGRSLGVERLAYQATMPGLDEELFFRGLLLAVLAAAVPSGGLNLLGARITLAGLLVTLLFGLGHGVGFSDGAAQVGWIYIIVTGYVGFGLLWIRERTGSLLLPLVGHNVINLTGSFF
jgi:hypothetical protein